MSNNTEIQSRNTDLTTLLNKIKALSGGVTLTSTTFSFANSGSKLYKSRLADNNIDLTGLLAMTANLHSPKIKVPSQSGSLTYTGYALSPTWSNYDSSLMAVSGTTSATNAGTYTATFTPKSGYAWSDGTTDAKDVTWTIGKAAGSLSISKTSITLNASTTSTTFTVTRAGNGTITVTSSNTSVATATLSGTTVTVKSVNSTTGSATITVKVASGTNHTAPSNKTCSVTATFSKTLSTYGTITLPETSYWGAGLTVGSYAVLHMGQSTNVYAYNSSLTRTACTDTTYTKGLAACATVGSYGLFMGGDDREESEYDIVDAYNTSLVHSNPTSLYYGRTEAGATSVGNYAVIAGGYDFDGSKIKRVEAYSSSLTRSTATSLPANTAKCSAAHIGNYAIFSGETFVAYNSSLTQSTLDEFSGYIGWRAGASTDNGAVFLTQSPQETYVPTKYNSSLVKTTLSTFTSSDWIRKAIGSNNNVLIRNQDSPMYRYNESFVLSAMTIEASDYGLNGFATIGSYVFFFSGEGKNQANNKMYTYTLK